MKAFLSLALKFLEDIIARIITDWRRDKALEAKGAAEATAAANNAAADAERAAAATPRKTEDQTIDTLRRGEF